MPIPTLFIDTMDTLAVRLSDVEGPLPLSERAKLLLVYLYGTNASATRSELAALFWHDVNRDKRLTRLQGVLNQLHAVLPWHILYTMEVVHVNWLAPVEFDQQALRKTLRKVKRLPLDPALAREVHAALLGQHGQFLRGVPLVESGPIRQWIVAQRRHDRQLLHLAVNKLLAYHREQGAPQRGVPLVWHVLNHLSDEGHAVLVGQRDLPLGFLHLEQGRFTITGSNGDANQLSQLMVQLLMTAVDSSQQPHLTLQLVHAE